MFQALNFTKGGIPSQIATSSFFDARKISLVVLDDLMVESSDDKSISNLFTRGSHHMNLSVIYIVQNLFNRGKMSRNISLNSQYLVLFKSPRDKQQILVLARQLYPRGAEKFLNVYENAIQKPHGYLFVDLKPSTPDHQRLKTNILPGESLGSTSSNTKSKEMSAFPQAIQKLADSVQTYFQGQRYMQPPQLAQLQTLDHQINDLLWNKDVPNDVKAKLYGQLFQRHQQFSDALKTLTASSNDIYIHNVSPNSPGSDPQRLVKETNDRQNVLSPQLTTLPQSLADSGIGSTGFSTTPADVFGKIRRNIEERRKRLLDSGGTPSRFISSMDSEQEKKMKLQRAGVQDTEQIKRKILDQTQPDPKGPLAQAWISMTDDENTAKSKIREARKRERKPTQLFTPSDF